VGASQCCWAGQAVAGGWQAGGGRKEVYRSDKWRLLHSHLYRARAGASSLWEPLRRYRRHEFRNIASRHPTMPCAMTSHSRAARLDIFMLDIS